jgi:transcriptional regulator with XRE-family HTH domain
MLQTSLAHRVGVHRVSVQNWERGIGVPGIKLMPKIIEFLGYDPEPPPACLAAQIAYFRRHLGITQEELAVAIKTDPMKVSRWEKGETKPTRASIQMLRRLLGNRFLAAR